MKTSALLTKYELYVLRFAFGVFLLEVIPYPLVAATGQIHNSIPAWIPATMWVPGFIIGTFCGLKLSKKGRVSDWRTGLMMGLLMLSMLSVGFAGITSMIIDCFGCGGEPVVPGQGF